MRSLWLAAAALALAVPSYAADQPKPDPALQKIVTGPQRSANFAARDPLRHPVEELTFFGVTPSSSLVEIWPDGGNYWLEILAPYLRDHGTYYAAGVPKPAPDDPPARVAARSKQMEGFAAKLKSDPVYDKVVVTEFGKDHYDIAPPGSADFVVSFRNLHNWMAAGYADQALAGFFKALKPGGILGLEDHRGREDVTQDPKAASGYVRQDYAIELAKKAGFEFVGSSEIDANPKDTKDWPEGVWTLAPTFALGDQDKAKYAAIGEADNFVLKFRKPLK
ncbi:MAG TPA: methyltransferase [Aliidongia sp.]|nr:methyltransferase [Aliidongia sp.]